MSSSTCSATWWASIIILSIRDWYNLPDDSWSPTGSYKWWHINRSVFYHQHHSCPGFCYHLLCRQVSNSGQTTHLNTRLCSIFQHIYYGDPYGRGMIIRKWTCLFIILRPSYHKEITYTLNIIKKYWFNITCTCQYTAPHHDDHCKLGANNGNGLITTVK